MRIPSSVPCNTERSTTMAFFGFLGGMFCMIFGAMAEDCRGREVQDLEIVQEDEERRRREAKPWYIRGLILWALALLDFLHILYFKGLPSYYAASQAISADWLRIMAVSGVVLIAVAFPLMIGGG